jgi:riboflavin biosynthesis pyrimidine reductase
MFIVVVCLSKMFSMGHFLVPCAMFVMVFTCCYMNNRATLSMNGIITNQIGKGADQSGGYYSQLMKEYDGVIISSDLAKMSALPLSREAGTNQPLCIIIAQGESSRLHIPSLSQEHASRAIVLADSPVTVEPAGVEVAVFRQIDLESILQLLAQRGLCSVLVDFREAGESFASLLNDFQEDKLVQQPGIWWQPIVPVEELGAQGCEWECAAGRLCVIASLLSEIGIVCFPSCKQIAL